MRPAAYLLVSGRGRPLRLIIASTRAERAAASAEARRINGVLVRAAVQLDCRRSRHRARRRARRRDRVATAVRGAVCSAVRSAVRAAFDAVTPARVDPAAEFDTCRAQLVAEFGEDGFERMRRNVTSFYLAWPR